jgi:ATP-binding cassette subfamily C protein
VEVVRDTYAGLVIIIRGFVVTVAGVVVGLLSIAPVVALLILPPFLLGLGGFVAILGLAAARASVLADERLSAAAGQVFASHVPSAPPKTAAGTGHAVVLRDVTFAYGPHAEPIVRHLDLTIAEGEHLAVVGPSGIGKSTVASLICGLRRPDHGDVTLGGAPAAESDPATRVLIPQEAYVFTGTLRENLTYLRPDATTADLDAATQAIDVEFGDYDTEIHRSGNV